MRKYYPHFITILFCLFLFGFGIVLLVSPSRESSEQENRQLAQFEAPTFKTVRTGEFMKSFEKYVTDQFPLRDGWIRLNTDCERLAGKKENGGVYFGRDGKTLFAQFNALSDGELAKKVGYVNKLAENLDVPVYFGLIPDKSYVWADRLPDNAPLVDDGSMRQKAAALCSSRVRWIDLNDALSGDDAFYRTDHHWSTTGACQCDTALETAMGGTPYDSRDHRFQPFVRSRNFYGTTWSACGASWIAPDEICTLIPEGGTTGHTAVTSYSSGKPEPGALYDLSQTGKYAMFLGGNQPLCVIENPDAVGGSLLVIRDSYADSLAPFLSESWREVHLFDLRYNRTPIPQYVEENGIDQVLVLYSAANFTTDTNLFLMGR